ncbi:hypothetical protein B1772_02945 [Dehalococcoides mccartyi]|jgi:hypothetical protein|uniref:hypothetical protein n=1 Tax=Dehalococcoides mccartyi TaxID=61435 RepID=UPI0009A4803E|nr:hypothetical protein [Dehalococcoides mccartyi]AQY73055.1 hypothetical protein B1772_02945 [Dehalococcoides mccartyi]
MEYRKTYSWIKPELLFDTLKDLITKQGGHLVSSSSDNYSVMDSSSDFIFKGTMAFSQSQNGSPACASVYVMGSERKDSRVILDIEAGAFGESAIKCLLDEVNFLLGEYEKI